VCVACQVVQHMLRTAKGFLDVDHPVVPVQPVEKRAKERGSWSHSKDGERPASSSEKGISTPR
jgi:hypothetical protein